MEKYQHLKLPLFQGDVERKKREKVVIKYDFPKQRNKAQFSQQAKQITGNITSNFSALKERLSGRIDPTLIFEIEINQSVSPDTFEQTLASMGMHVVSVAEDKKGYWVVFSEDEDLSKFKLKLAIYGSEESPKYDFFHAIESFGDIPVEKKIGERLVRQPLTDTADFIDIELWKMDNPQKN